MTDPASERGDAWWTDVINPWTLNFRERQNELLFGGQWRQSRARMSAMGSLAAIVLPTAMAVKVMFVDGGDDQGFAYGTYMLLVLIAIRGAPFFVYVLLPKTAYQHILPAVTVTSRLLNAVFAVHYIVMLQMLGQITGCQLVRGVFMDVLMSFILDPLLKPTMFRGYAMLSTLESAAVMYAIASQHGACGALQVLEFTDPQQVCPASCVAQQECHSTYNYSPVPAQQLLPNILKTALSWAMKYGVGAPEGATSFTKCPQVVVAGIDRCKVLSRALRSAALFMGRLSTWLSSYPYHDPRLLQPQKTSTCSAVFILLVVLIHGVVGCVLYCTEAMSRCRFWQGRHGRVALHPPLNTLRNFLLVQNVFFVLAVVCGTWLLLASWL